MTGCSFAGQRASSLDAARRRVRPAATPPPTPTPVPPTMTPIPPTPVSPTPTPDPAAPVKAWVDAINRGDVDAALALFTDKPSPMALVGTCFLGTLTGQVGRAGPTRPVFIRRHPGRLRAGAERGMSICSKQFARSVRQRPGCVGGAALKLPYRGAGVEASAGAHRQTA